MSCGWKQGIDWGEELSETGSVEQTKEGPICLFLHLQCLHCRVGYNPAPSWHCLKPTWDKPMDIGAWQILCDPVRLFHNCSALHVQSQHNERTRRSKCSADWLMRVLVNELAQPQVRSQQGQYVQQY